MSHGLTKTVSSRLALLRIILLVAALGVVALIILPAPGSKQHAIIFKEAQQIAARLEQLLQATGNGTSTHADAKLLRVSPFRKDIVICVTSSIATQEERDRLGYSVRQFCHEESRVIFRGDFSDWQPEEQFRNGFPVWLDTRVVAATNSVGAIPSTNAK